MRQGLLIQKITLLTFSRGIADHTGCPTNKRQRLMATMLKKTEHHHTAQVANVQRVGRRINADVSCDSFFLNQFFCSRHELMQHPTPS